MAAHSMKEIAYLNRLERSAARLSRQPVELEPLWNGRLPYYDRKKAKTRYLALHPSLSDELTIERAQAWIRHIRTLKEPVSFEIIGLNGKITAQVVVQEQDLPMLQDSLLSYYPNCSIQQTDDLLYPHYRKLKELKSQRRPMEFHLLDSYSPRSFLWSFPTFAKQAADPLEPLYVILSQLEQDELGFYQVVFIPCRQNWASFVEKGLEDLERGLEHERTKGRLKQKVFERQGFVEALKNWGIDEFEYKQSTKMLNARRDKLRSSSVYYAVALRLGVFAPKQRSLELLRRLHSGIAPFQDGERGLAYLTRRDYYQQGLPKQDHFYLVFNRVSFHPGILMNDLEFSGFCHLPLAQSLARGHSFVIGGKTALAPSFLAGPDGLLLGQNEHRGEMKEARLPDHLRMRHVYVAGMTRTGKSTLLTNCILQDMKAGRGVGVIDPHGDLVDELLPLMPEHRVNDVVLLDARDKQSPVTLNMLAVQDEDETGPVVADLIVTLRRLFEDSWGARMEHILRHALYTLVKAGGKTFADIKRILIDEAFREAVVSQVRDRELRLFWEEEFEKLPSNAIDPVINKLSPFLLDPTIRRILCQPGKGIDVSEIMERGQLLLAALGGVGEANAQLLGTILVSQIQLAAMRRAKQQRERRRPFFLYIDEFHTMTASDPKSVERILSEAGKYLLSITMAHQFISQLPQALQKAVTGNVGTVVAFRLGEADARALEGELGQFSWRDLINLGVGETIVRVGKSQDTFNLKTLPPPLRPARDVKQRILEQARKIHDVASESEPAAIEVVVPHVVVQPSTSVIHEKEAEALIAEPVISPESERNRPAPAVEKTFATHQDKALYYVTLAEYLSTQQIIQLCYSHLAESARKAAASRDLRKLVAEKRLKVQPFGRGNVYYASRTCAPTTHNLAIRDLFVKIVQTGYEIADVNFSLSLKGLTPDLFVAFLAEDGSFIKTCWEYDTGTEGVAEILSKVKRYELYRADHLIAFVVTTPERLEQLMNAIPNPSITFAVMSEFETLHELVFRRSDTPHPVPFFSFL